jgi:hypothetical protein
MMRPLWVRTALFALLFALTSTLGCNRPAPPPTPLSEQEVPGALEKAFSKARPELKDLATQVVSALQAKDYAKAFQTIQDLANRPSLSKDQVSVTARASLTLNSLLQTAETKGDVKAAQTLKSYRRDK